MLDQGRKEGRKERVLSPSFFTGLSHDEEAGSREKREGPLVYFCVRGLERLYICVALSRLARSIPSS